MNPRANEELAKRGGRIIFAAFLKKCGCCDFGPVVNKLLGTLRCHNAKSCKRPVERK